MTDVTAQSRAVLLRVAEFLGAIPEEHLTDLVNGSAILTIIPAGSSEALQRPAPQPRASRATKRSTVDIAAVAEAVCTAQTRAGAMALLRPLRKDPDLKEIAERLNVTGLGSLPKDRLIDAIVEGTVGSRLDFQAIQGTATLPY